MNIFLNQGEFMSDLDIEKCLKYTNSRFELVLIAAERAKEIMFQNINENVKLNKDKPVVLALKEIESGSNLSRLNKNTSIT